MRTFTVLLPAKRIRDNLGSHLKATGRGVRPSLIQQQQEAGGSCAFWIYVNVNEEIISKQYLIIEEAVTIEIETANP